MNSRNVTVSQPPIAYTILIVLRRGWFFLSLWLLLPLFIRAQSIIEDTTQRNFNFFYEQGLTTQHRVMPYPSLRESDVIWAKTIWRTIDLRMRYNQFFYYPIERQGQQGRLNFAYLVWDAIVNNEIPIYEDDEFKIPLDNDSFVFRYTKADTIILEIEDDDESIEYRTVLVPKEFNSEDILQIRLKETWYQEKQTTGQYVRITGFTLVRNLYKEVGLDRDFIGTVELFWIPMQSPLVRQLLATHEVFFDRNLAQLPTWDELFIKRRFDSYITRESNTWNRSVGSYLTGLDAIMEAERIEEELNYIESDQWEY